MAKTQKEMITATLIKHGCKIDYKRSGKYEAYSIPDSKNFYFLGSSGSFRIGKCASKSKPVSDNFKEAVIDGVIPDLSIKTRLLFR